MPVNRVTFEQAQRLLEEGAVYLDVRSVPEFEAGHPPGAYNIPVLHTGPSGMMPNRAFIEEVEANFSKDTPLVIGCRSGGRSAQAAAALQRLGYERLYDYMGGFGGGHGDPGWVAAGGPSTNAAEQGRSYEELKTSGR